MIDDTAFRMIIKYMLSTSAVTVHRFEVFQRLTNPWGAPETTEVV
jgi:hypothetical protein